MHFESCHLNYLGNYSKLVTWCHLGLPTLLSYNKGHKNFIDIYLSAHILIQFLQIIIDANIKYSSKLHFSYLNENTKTRKKDSLKLHLPWLFAASRKYVSSLMFLANSKQSSFMLKYMRSLFLINSTEHQLLSSCHLDAIKLKTLSE